ncbi:MAG: carbohydrate kinase family protein [Acidobacteria bacterium]|nr:carbohydrate kinase family protein [Acidobacteriota bacterium]MCL5287500.1 carbohydrate kinase family protein [Acidobacteriota bacterium]
MEISASNVDVVGVGLNATDTLIRLPHFPAFDSKVEFLSADILPGGQVASAMVACAAWGIRARYIGKVGDDHAAQMQLSELTRAGVESHLISVPHCTSQTAYILVDEKTGERTILWRRDPRLALRPEEIQREWIVAARALHVDGHDTAAAAQAARWAREASIPVTVDVDNLYAGVEELLKHVDYLMASRDFPARLTGEPDLAKSLPAIQQRFGHRLTGVTLGRAGALAWDGRRFLPCPGYVVDAVDTTGAGDIFHGAFIYGVLQAWPMERILEFSCAAAALNCTALGARGGIKPVEEIERLMRKGQRTATPDEILRIRGTSRSAAGAPE